MSIFEAQISKFALPVILFLFVTLTSPAQTYEYYLDMAAEKFAAGDTNSAIALCTEAIELDGAKKRAHFERAGYHVALINKIDASADYKNYQAAVTDYSKVLELDQTDAEALFYRGGAHSTIGFLAQAIEDYKASLLIDDNQPKVYNSLAVSTARMGDPNAALSYIKQAVQIDPNYAKAYSNMGNIYDMLGDAVQACNNWKKAIELGYNGNLNRVRSRCE